MRYAPLATTLLVAACGGTMMPEVRPLPMPASTELTPFAEAYQAGKDHLRADRAGLAIVMFEKALAIDPTSVAALNAIGAAYDELHRPDVAKTYYTKALALEPNGADTLNNMAISAALAGDAAASRELLAQAASIDPANPTIRGNIQVADSKPPEAPEPPVDEDANRPRLDRTGLQELTLRLPAGAFAPRDGGVPMEIGYANRDPLAPIDTMSITAAALTDRHPVTIERFAADDKRLAPSANGTPTLAAVQLAALRGGQISLAGLVPYDPTPRTPVMSEALAPPQGARAENGHARVIAAAVTLPAPATVPSPVDAARPTADVAKPAPLATPAPAHCALEVSNGAGRDGMARRVRDFLTAHEIAAGRLTNATSFDHAETTLFHRPDAEATARQLAGLLPNAVVLRADPDLGCAVRLELGRDLLPFDGQLSKPNHDAQ
ncbi:hypothetical protein GCM10011611_20150 [Aliidongia dinghuensis]|uniref:LytR/CpsA/Psr regulator C-terminal domain-containing protein n=1 Tax=Aliidongia dinghuensis TaxID=1867774 RepID=A0A8J2YSP4_9PROT|nr:LytR C-terminal domain-containing protein [Aliidongia dinghuensis]GGF14337.1 hypothetical protein GCM10011611_20150 [Aliidongia dinghuensis]